MAPGILYAPTRDHGLWRLPGGETSPDAPMVPFPGIAPAATDGERVALSLDEGIQLFRLDERLRRTWEATPAPWYPPAVDGDLVAWVDVGAGTEDVWVLHQGEATPLAVGPGHERHVAVSGGQVGWIDDQGVNIWNATTGEQETWATDAHTSRRLSLDGSTACWEAWNGTDIDVHCSDGVIWDGPGHQRSPDRQGEQLLVVDRGRALLLVFAEASSSGP